MQHRQNVTVSLITQQLCTHLFRTQLVKKNSLPITMATL